jgi:hypothetical protein
VFDCSQNIGVGILRGLGDVKSSFRISLIGYWLIGLPVAYLAGIVMGYGIHGIWVGLAIGLAATASLLLRTFETRLGRSAAIVSKPAASFSTSALVSLCASRNGLITAPGIARYGSAISTIAPMPSARPV